MDCFVGLAGPAHNSQWSLLESVYPKVPLLIGLTSALFRPQFGIVVFRTVYRKTPCLIGLSSPLFLHRRAASFAPLEGACVRPHNDG